MNAHKLTHIAIIAIYLALAGCASTGAATPTGTQPPQPPITEAAAIVPTEASQLTATLSPTDTSLPTLAPDQPTQIEPPTPENTPVPIATNYPDPAVPLSPTGPWLVFRDTDDIPSFWDNGYLWAMNQDGTGLTRLTNEPVYAFAVRPTSTVQNGLTIAYITLNCCDQGSNLDGSALKILSWPSGDVKTIVSNNLSHAARENFSMMTVFTAYSMEGLVWSPSGNKLAFVGAIDGYDTALNVFVYDVVTEQITRISANNDSDDYRLVWSPDEHYVIHQSFKWSAMGGNMTNVTDGVWSAQVNSDGVTQLVGRLGYQWISYVECMGWLSPTEIVLNFDQLMQGESISNRNIRVINIETGESTTLVSEPLLDVAYSPEYNLFLMTKEAAPSPDRLLIFYQNSERREIAGYSINRVQWLSAYDVFLGYTPDGHVYLISPDGMVTEVPSPEWKVKSYHPVLTSPDGQWWAWHHYHNPKNDAPPKIASELWVGPAMAQPPVLLSVAPGLGPNDGLVYYSNIIWTPNSQYLLWASGQGIFVASPPNFEATLVAKIDADFSDAVWVQ